MDTIRISHLSLITTIGAYAWEQQVTQQLWLDVEYRAAPVDDAEALALEQRYDYAQIATAITEFVALRKTRLIETLVEDIARFCQESLQLTWVRLTLTKPGALANAQGVSITISREVG